MVTWRQLEFACLSFPCSGRTWLKLMLLELEIPIGFLHGQLTDNNKLLTDDNGVLILRGSENKDYEFKNNLAKETILLWRNPFDILCAVVDKWSIWTTMEQPMISYRRQTNFSTKEAIEDSKHNFRIILQYHIAVIEYCKQYNIPIYYLSYYDLQEQNKFIKLCNYFGYCDLNKIKSVYKKYSIDNMFKLPEEVIIQRNLHRKINLGPDRDYRKIMSKEHINSLQEIISELDYNNKVAAKFNVVL